METIQIGEDGDLRLFLHIDPGTVYIREFGPDGNSILALTNEQMERLIQEYQARRA